MSNKVTDLEDIFKNWAWQRYVDTMSWFSRIGFSNASFKVIWSKIKLTPCDPQYRKIRSIETSQVVFESKYENNTDDDQTHNFRAEKETISSAVIKLTKGFTKDTTVGYDLPMPPSQNLPEAAKAFGSFGTRFHLDSEEGSSVEKKLKWSVDTTVTSKSRNVTVAKLEVEETQVAYDFTMDVKLKGRVIVVISNSSNKDVVKTIEGDVATIFFDMQDGELSDYVEDARIDLTKSVVTWPVVGTLVMKYGISQKVNISYLRPTGHRSGAGGRWPKY